MSNDGLPPPQRPNPTFRCGFEPKHDPINHPAHYQSLPGFESIDVIQAALTPEEFQGFCKGNMLKYRFRAGKKGPAETCLAKADWYEARAKSALESGK